ncbi:MAG: hypothetical protein V3T08_09075 [Gemmatimonadota bacterium]
MKIWTLVLGTLLLSNGSLWAQHVPPAPDPIERHIFPPELVMEHQRALGLSDDQEELIKKEILRTQTRFTELQWQLQEEVETMSSLLDRERVEEDQILDQLDKVLATEREMKRTHFTLVVRIKNVLTPDQQAQLRKMMGRHPEKAPRAPGH